MNKNLLFAIIVFNIIIHVTMIVYFSQKNSSTERNALLTVLSFVLLGELINFIHLVENKNVKCISPS